MATIVEQILSEEAVTAVRSAIRDEQVFIDEVAAKNLPDDATMWEIEQQLRREILGLVQLGTWDHDDSTAQAQVLVKYFELAHATLDSATMTHRLDPKAVQDAVFRAEAWARERVKGDIWLGRCDMGRQRRFISEGVDGLTASLAQLGVTVRYDTRSHSPQIRTRDGRWVEFNDRIEATLRESIAALFSFMRKSAKDSDEPRAVRAAWSGAAWQICLLAHLGGHEVDGFREWLERLPPWDRTPRLNSWLTSCGFAFADAEENVDLVEWAARSIPLVACIRTLEPGVKHDTVPVLIGPQDCGKSTALAWLMPPEYRSDWFDDTLKLSADEKRRVEALQGAVIVEAAEMTGATTADIESLKAFCSRTNDRIRLAYRRNPEPHPRRCSIAGTANGTAVLPNDPTGNRRFVALPIERGDVLQLRAWLNGNRGQLWAEAWMRAKAGEPAFFPSDLKAAQDAVNETVRSSDTILEDSIRTWLEGRLSEIAPDRLFRLSEAAEASGILRGDEKSTNLPTAQVRRLTRILERFGCQPTRRTRGGQFVRMWEMPETVANAAGEVA